MMSKKSRLYGGWGCLGCCFGWCPKQAVGLWASICKSWHAPLAPFHQILLLFLDECFDSKTPSKEELAKLLHPTHNRNKIVKYQMLGNGQEVEFSDSVKYEVSSSQGSLKNGRKLFFCWQQYLSKQEVSFFLPTLPPPQITGQSKEHK